MTFVRYCVYEEDEKPIVVAWSEDCNHPAYLKQHGISLKTLLAGGYLAYNKPGQQWYIYEHLQLQYSGEKEKNKRKEVEKKCRLIALRYMQQHTSDFSPELIDQLYETYKRIPKTLKQKIIFYSRAVLCLFNSR